MSVKLVAWAWDSDFPTTDKMVLLCLCDFANDEGGCWPSVATLIRKTGLAERTVQNAIKRLCDGGVLSRAERAGTSTKYHINPRTTCTPAGNAPPHLTTDTPAPRAPHPRTTCTLTTNEPSRTINVDKAKALPTTRARTEPVEIPDWIPPDAWAGYVAMRRAIRKPLTGRAIALAVQKLAALADDGHPPGEVLDQSTAASWQGLFALKDNGNGQHRQASDRGGSTRTAAQIALGRLGRH